MTSYARDPGSQIEQTHFFLVCRQGESGHPDVRFIDFDSSGREGEVFYPGFRNPRIPSPPGVASHQPMMSLHDSELLQACIARSADPHSRSDPPRRKSSTALPAHLGRVKAGLHTIMQPPVRGKQKIWNPRGVSAIASEQSQFGAGPRFYLECYLHQARGCVASLTKGCTCVVEGDLFPKAL